MFFYFCMFVITSVYKPRLSELWVEMNANPLTLNFASLFCCCRPYRRCISHHVRYMIVTNLMT